jgi:hypothetical protein
MAVIAIIPRVTAKAREAGLIVFPPERLSA